MLVRSLSGVSPLPFASHLVETIRSYIYCLSPSESKPMGKTPSFPSRMITIWAFENFRDFAYPVTILETHLVLLVRISMLLHMVQAFFRVKKRSVAIETPPTHSVPTQTSVTGQQEATTQDLFLSELQDIHKYFSCCPDEHTTTQLFWCWDNGTKGLELEGRNHFLRKHALTRWLQERHKLPASGSNSCQTWRKGILTRLMLHVTMQVKRYPILEGISHDRDLFWPGQYKVPHGSRPIRLHVTHMVEVCRVYQEYTPTHCQCYSKKTSHHHLWIQWLAISGNVKTISLPLSSVEKLSDKLSQEFQQFKEDMFYSPPLQTHANDSKRWLKRRYMPWDNLWV